MLFVTYSITFHTVESFLFEGSHGVKPVVLMEACSANDVLESLPPFGIKLSQPSDGLDHRRSEPNGYKVLLSDGCPVRTNIKEMTGHSDNLFLKAFMEEVICIR